MSTSLIVLGSIWGGVVLLRVAFALAEAMARRRTPRAWPPPESPHWTLRLLVEDKDGSGLLWPIVDIVPAKNLDDALLRVEVLDNAGTAHPGSHTTASIAGPSQLELPPFRPPADATVADMLGWRWRVWLGEGRRELARWEGRLSSVGRINPEAELELARG